MAEVKFNAIVGQSGGPTSAINATLAGVIYGAFQSECIDTLYGAFNGVEGILNNSYCNLTELFGSKDQDIELLSKTPAAALGSCRVKLPSPEKEDSRAVYDKLFKFFEERNIKYFFYIGGNDSMDTVSKLSAASVNYSWKMQFIGVPKTIDNDLCGTDHTPGYGSAAKYIATSISEIVRDCAVYTVKSVTIVEIMGRDAGWLTAAAAIPRFVGEGPDYVYLPEKAFSLERFFKDLEKAFEIHPNVVIAVSEGIRFEDGRYVGESTQSGVTDAFGHKYLSGTAKALEYEIRNKFGCKVRSFDLNLPQRCAGHLMSETDRLESIGVGRAAVEYAEKGCTSCLICYERTDSPYSVTYAPKDIAGIANQIKTVPDSYINAEGNGITGECFDYIHPLILGNTDIPYENGIPKHCIIMK